MNTDYTDFTYNSLEQIHEIFCSTRWRDSLVAGKLLFVSCLAKVVHASSSSAYSDTPELPKREDMKPDPKSPYAVAKLTGEYYCRDQCQ